MQVLLSDYTYHIIHVHTLYTIWQDNSHQLEISLVLVICANHCIVKLGMANLSCM